MNDPRQSAPNGAPRPAGIPQAPSHAPQHPQPHAPGVAPAAPRPVARPAPAQHPATHAPSHHPHPVHAPAQHSHPTGPAKIAPMPTMVAPSRGGDDAIALIEDGEDADTLHKKIKAFGADSAKKIEKWNRLPAANPQGAVRVRTFHAKLSDQGLEYLDDAINHFIDAHPEVQVKFVTTNVGMFDGKFKDLALIVNIWY